MVNETALARVLASAARLQEIVPDAVLVKGTAAAHYAHDREPLVQRLSEPNPRDSRTTRQLGAYKGLVERWHDWSAVVSDCTDLADAIVELLEGE